MRKMQLLINHHERNENFLEEFKKFHFVGDYTYKILPIQSNQQLPVRIDYLKN